MVFWISTYPLQGDAGDKGDKGDTGDQGQKGDQGDPGLDGTNGEKGDAGDAGDKGEKGDQGEQGVKGLSYTTNYCKVLICGEVGGGGVIFRFIHNFLLDCELNISLNIVIY